MIHFPSKLQKIFLKKHNFPGMRFHAFCPCMVLKPAQFHVPRNSMDKVHCSGCQSTNIVCARLRMLAKKDKCKNYTKDEMHVWSVCISFHTTSQSYFKSSFILIGEIHTLKHLLRRNSIYLKKSKLLKGYSEIIAVTAPSIFIKPKIFAFL